MMRNIVILTGAGISAESGVPTFRDANGLWSGHKVEDVACPEAFVRNPELVYSFYNERRRIINSGEINPNPAHYALAELENAWKAEFTLVTQNIDNLHQRAGSINVFPMHGELNSAKCLDTGERFTWEEDLNASSVSPATGKAGSLRPDIVWFGEEPYYMPAIMDALRYCRLFIAIGTSGQVYPAAGFVEQVSYSCARTIEVNLKPTEASHLFQEHHYGKASELLPVLIELLLGQS